MMDIVERLAQQAAETINGGEFNDGKWYTEGQRQAWRKAMTPAADEIERLRKALKIFADNVKETNVGIDKYWAETVYALKTENQRLRETNKRLGEIAIDAVGWLPPASVNGPREEYQNEIKELTDGHC